MKNFLLILALVGTLYTDAQITINYSDYPEVGDSVMYDTTNVAGLNVGTSGANQIWDFSSMTSTYNATRSYLAPSASMYSNLFPSANMMIQMPGSETFLNVSSTGVEILGTVDDQLGIGVMTPAVYTNNLTSISFPTNYLDSKTDQYGYSITADGSSYGVDSIRVGVNGTVTSNIDGYGTLFTPTDSITCLREHSNFALNINIELYISMLGWQSGGAPQTQNMDAYTWVALGYGSGILETEANSSTGSVSRVFLAEYSSPPSSGIERMETNFFKVSMDFNQSFAAIEWSPNAESKSIQLIDHMGRVVENIIPEQKAYHILDLNNFAGGQYIIRLNTANNCLSKKIIIQ
tara:strand:+ start:3049 stop:4092 length:1044 start_codon:yes stop_codon:yes gene_type:complete